MVHSGVGEFSTRYLSRIFLTQQMRKTHLFIELFSGFCEFKLSWYINMIDPIN